MKWILFAEMGGGGEKSIEERDGETCESVRERRKEGNRISFGGRELVALWGFLPEFSLSGWGRKGRKGRGRQPGSAAAVWSMCRLDV